MNEEVRKYQLEHWKEYNLTDTEEEFIVLLNILEAHEESLDSLHDVALNNQDMFCGIYGSFENDRETVKALNEFNAFNKTEEEMKEVAKEFEQTYEEFLKYEDIRKTKDGFVRVLYY